jgi:hypothetical protein
MAENADTLDPRVTAARPELAARHLQGKVTAARFVEGEAREVAAAQAPLRRDPSPDAALLTEALKGERVTVYETTTEGWSWVQLATDGYVGWMPSAALSWCDAAPSHRVAALRTLVFPGPSIKLPPVDALSLGSVLAVTHIEGPFAVSRGGGCVPAQHLAPIASQESDWVAVAEKFAGVPYLWGGKTSLGIDCSGLVQVALAAAAIPCPRDSDMQECALGKPIPRHVSDLQRGDLLFWKGHVAIVQDREMLLHANAFHMAVAVEPIRDALARIRSAGSEVTSARRL